MQAVNQLSQPTGRITSNREFKQAKPAKPRRTSHFRYRYVTAVVVYLVLASTLITLTYLDNGYLFNETLSSMVLMVCC